MIKKKQFLLVLLGALLLCIVLLWLNVLPCSPMHPELLGDADAVLVAVSPPANANISFGCYIKRNFNNVIFRSQFLYTDPHNWQGWAEDGGINVKIFSNGNLVELEHGLTDMKQPGLEKRVFLYIDGEKIQTSLIWTEQTAVLTKDESNLAGSYIFGVNPILLPGDHIIKLEIQTLSGKVLIYQWRIKITLP